MEKKTKGEYHKEATKRKREAVCGEYFCLRDFILGGVQFRLKQRFTVFFNEYTNRLKASYTFYQDGVMGGGIVNVTVKDMQILQDSGTVVKDELIKSEPFVPEANMTVGRYEA